jgi:hypothetical protein
MSNNQPDSQLNEKAVHAHLSVVLALLKSNKLIECLAALNMVLLLITIAYTHVMLVKGVAAISFLDGIAVFYYSLRIRIDRALFEQWDSLDMNTLDTALMQLNQEFKAGKTLDLRLAGAYQLFKKSLLMLAIQFLLLLIVAWLFVLKV